MKKIAFLLFLSCATAQAQKQQVTLYCPAPGDWCQLVANEFEKATNISVNVLRKSAGEVLAQMRAEKTNPKGDVWWGGISDSHFAAAQEGLTQPIETDISVLQPWAQKIYTSSNKHAVGIYSLALGFGYNPELAAKKGFTPPQCFSDLLKPEYKGEIQMANPNSSGTGYQAIATLISLMGEDKAFDYMKKLHLNVNTYTRSGVAPSKAVARGETGVSLTYLQDAFVESNAGFPVKTVTPCEGTALGVDAMSLIKEGPNPENAKKFYTWLLSKQGQDTRQQAGLMHQPARLDAEQPPIMSILKDVKYIDYDYKGFGESQRRAHILKRWDAEIASLPR